jgi:hypothetical protein
VFDVNADTAIATSVRRFDQTKLVFFFSIRNVIHVCLDSPSLYLINLSLCYGLGASLTTRFQTRLSICVFILFHTFIYLCNPAVERIERSSR